MPSAQSTRGRRTSSSTHRTGPLCSLVSTATRAARTAHCPTCQTMPPRECRWVARWWRALAAEALATALLMVLGVGALLPAPAPLSHPALAFGGAVTALAAALGPVSGAHMNPAVTLAALFHRQLPPLAAAAYVAAQVLGAFLGFGVLMGVAPMEACAGVTLPAAGLGGAGAALVEAALTGALALVCGALWAAHDPRRPDPAAPLKLGATVAGLVYSGGKLTGASLNPARNLAPAALGACWAAHWAYWLGPLGGAALAALAHRALLPAARPAPPTPAAPPSPAPEGLPLHDKPEP